MHKRFTEWLRLALILALALSGAVVVARAALGPFRFALAVSSPLVAEGICGLAATLLLLLGTLPAKPTAAGSRWSPRTRLAGALALTAACLAWTLRFPLVCDEYVLGLQGLGMDWGAARAVITHPGADRFFRPLGDLSLRLDALWSHGVEPVGWRVLSLFLHLVNTALVFWLARRLFASTGVATWAAALFGIHGSRPEAVSFLARFDQLATLFVLAGLILFDCRRFVSCAALMLAGLLSKESAYVFPLLALWIMAWRGRWDRRHWRAAAALFALTAAVFGYRWSLLGGIGGYADRVTGQPHILNIRPVALLKGLTLRMWGLLYFPVNWSYKPEPWLAGAMALAVAAWIVLVLRSRADRRRLGLAAAFVLIAALPVAHMLLIGSDFRGAAHLYLPSVGFCLLLGAAMEGRTAAAAAILVFEVAATWHNIVIWDRTAHLAANVCRFAAAETVKSNTPPIFMNPPRILDGIAFFAVGLPECVALRAPGKAAVVAFGPDVPAAAAGTPVFRWNEKERRFEAAGSR